MEERVIVLLVASVLSEVAAMIVQSVAVLIAVAG